MDRPVGSAAGLAGGGPKISFLVLVSGKMGSGTHPPMLPSASGFQTLDFIAFLFISAGTSEAPWRPQHGLITLVF